MKLALVVVLLAGCQFSTTKRQVGLVPAPRPMSFDGQTMPSAMRVEGRASTILGSREASAATSGGQSAYVARDVLGGSVFGRIGDGELGVSLDVVRSRNASPMTAEAELAPAPLDNGYTLSINARRSVSLDDGWAIGLAGDLGWTKVPILFGDRESSDIAALYRAALVPSHRSGAVTVFGSLQLTNEIMVPATVTGRSPDPEASAGGLAVVPTLGASVRIGEGVKLTAQLAQPFNTPIDYGPQVELALGYELGEVR